MRIPLQANPLIGQTPQQAPPSSPRLSEVRERLKAHKAGRRISPSTLSEYLSTLEEFIAWKGDIPIRTLTGRDIGDFAHYMLEERHPKIAPRTWDKKLNAVNALFDLASLAIPFVGGFERHVLLVRCRRVSKAVPGEPRK